MPSARDMRGERRGFARVVPIAWAAPSLVLCACVAQRPRPSVAAAPAMAVPVAVTQPAVAPANAGADIPVGALAKAPAPVERAAVDTVGRAKIEGAGNLAVDSTAAAAPAPVVTTPAAAPIVWDMEVQE